LTGFLGYFQADLFFFLRIFLSQTLPKLVGKMERTATVMRDLPRMNQNPTEQLLTEESRKSKKAKTSPSKTGSAQKPKSQKN